MKEVINKIRENKRHTMICIIIFIIILTLLISWIYIYPKMQNDVLFDKNPILKDRWTPLEQNEVIDNVYEFASNDSKLSSIVITLQIMDL